MRRGKIKGRETGGLALATTLARDKDRLNEVVKIVGFDYQLCEDR